MGRLKFLKSALIGGVSAIVLAGPVQAREFNIPGGDLDSALAAYSSQSGIELIVSSADIRGVHTSGAVGDMSATAALTRILTGTGFTVHRNVTGKIGIAREEKHSETVRTYELAQALPPNAAPRAATSVETVVVTSSKIKGDIQTVPIAITALSQEQLTSRQIAGGPDLVKEVPNLTFTKTNFSGYSIQIRGIGTQAISVTTDPAVAVALNDIPFIRNHFFEQEFFDVGQVEVLRGPQGTLYGRNATAGVVNVISAKPTDQFEAMLSADWGNYSNRRYEGMVNIPIVDDRADLRIAGEWTKRDGYSTNELTGDPIDGRDLWSTRVTLSVKPTSTLQAWLVWEHFQENDDRLRTSKQLCKTDPTPSAVGGVLVGDNSASGNAYVGLNYLSQGCAPSSLYSAEAFEVPNGHSLPYYAPLSSKWAPLMADYVNFDPYASTTQSRDLRVIESQLDPIYKTKNDTVEFNVDYNLLPELTFTSQTGYNQDSLWSTEDYNRFNTAPGAFAYTDPAAGLGHNSLGQVTPDPSGFGICATNESGGCNGISVGEVCNPSTDGNDCHMAGVFCDPQLGCSNRLVAEDLDTEHAWQLSQEFRLASNFSGPLNFSIGGNYLHYETDENYYVFINSLTLAAYSWSRGTGGGHIQTLPWVPGVSDNSNCIYGGFMNSNPGVPTLIGTGERNECMYIDPNPITKLDNKGHNYFLSQNPYGLNSYALFGETYYNLTKELKLTGGLRWTSDHKHFIDIPSELLVHGYGYPVAGTVNQSWNQFTGRAAVNWTPKLDFTDQTLVYGSYAHGYKAGGANPPGALLLSFTAGDKPNPIHPLTFKPEFIDAFELGSKNTMLDGGLTLDGDVFFYNYKGYQISRIVDRTAINDNFDARVQGAELEAMWEPLPGLKFNFAGGYEHTRIANGEKSVDLMDRADLADHPDWMVVKPFPTQASNCVLPVYVVAAILEGNPSGPPNVGGLSGACAAAYTSGLDPVVYGAYFPSWEGPSDPTRDLVTGQPYYQPYDSFGEAEANTFHGYPVTIAGVFPNLGTTISYPGFNPATAPNNGEGFDKNLGGNELPNAPHFTTSLSAEYTMPISEDWAATLHSDFYWQSQSWARVFNDRPYDKLRGYSNVNLALILTSADGWQVLGYLKNIFDTTQITGDFLNSDDSGLTTNVFLTDPRLFGVRVTKNW